MNHIRTLLDEAQLLKQLDRACDQKPKGRVVVGISCEDSLAFAPNARDYRSLTGCLTKVFTAALMSQAIADGAFDLDDPVAEILHLKVDQPSALQGISVRHLLNHTHGLDLSSVRSVPRTSNGYVDVGALCSPPSCHRRLHDPGDLYSYSNTGSWISASILEHHFKERYDELLITRLLKPLGIRPATDSTHGEVICPALGGTLSLTVQDLLCFLRCQIGGDEVDVENLVGRGIMPGEPIPLPGLAIERGTCLGWKYYGDGWFGHNALLRDESTLARFNVDNRIGIVVTGDNRLATLVLARLFGRALPEFSQLKIPRPLPNWEPNESDLDAYTGSYENAATQAIVTRTGATTLGLEIFEKSTDADWNSQVKAIRSTMQPCADGAFRLEPKAIEFGVWIQFIRPAAQRYSYLWNGREVLLRSPTVS